MTGLIFIAIALVSIAATITIKALAEDYRLVRNWRKEHGR